MNAKSTISRQKLMAMGVVAMFVMCAFAICIPADSDAGPYGGVTNQTTDPQNQIYKVEISVGQTFTYTGITTNLSNYDDATVHITGAWTTAPIAGNYDGFDYVQDATSFTGSFKKAGEYTYVFTAKSSHPAGSSTLEQTATQTLNFIVKDKIELPTSASGYAIVDETAIGETLITIPYKGPATSENITTTTLKEGDSDSTKFSFEYSGNNILIKAKEAFASKSSYNLTLTVLNNNSKDTDSTSITVTVFEDIAVTNAGEHLYTYEGKDLSDFTFEVNWADDSDETTKINTHVLAVGTTTTGSKGNSVGTNPLTITGSDSYTVNIDTSDKTSGINTGDNLYADFTATLTVTGIIEGTSQTEGVTTPEKITEAASGTVTLRVYKALEFATVPDCTNMTITPITAAGTTINFSAYIKGANSVIFDWGDGIQTSSMGNDGKAANNYGANHTYAKSGVYTVTVFATNDHGTTSAQVLYNAGEGDITLPTEDTPSTDSDKKSFFDEHGYQFLIFAILTVLLLVAFFYFGFQNPMVIILAIVMAALAVLCFVYNDISGVIDAVKGLFNKA